MSNQKEMIVGRLVLTGILKLCSPLMIGTGEDHHSDNDVLLDKKGNPYIPATSIAGVLSHRIGLKNSKFVNLNKDYKNLIEEFWGTARQTEDGQTSGKQSEIIISDAILSNTKSNPIIRDQIRMNPALGITEDGAKFDYEIVEPNVEFQFKIEIGYTKKKKDFIFRMFKTIETLLSNSEISFGSKTGNGLGKVKLIEPNFYDYDFSKKDNVFAWLERNKEETSSLTEDLNKIQPFRINSSQFKISLIASIDNSLIIGSSSSNTDADKVHIRSAGKHVLTGSSLKGVIRSRATKILNTINPINQKENDEVEKLKENLFGFVEEEIDELEDDKFFNLKNRKVINKKKLCGLLEDKDGKRVKTQKSRLFVTEEFIERKNQEINEQLQHRIKIDRFTGGTIESALFNSMPIFSNNDTFIKTNIIINDCDEQLFPNWNASAGLLLLVLKDLWTGDLPIGGEKNVGRGRLKGLSATITIPSATDNKDNTVIELTSDENGNPITLPENWNKLEEFVTALNSLVGKT